MEIEREKKLKINVEKLQNQVRQELLADEKYQRENSAKLRAVEQRVPTYEDFRQIVLASNLRPLDRGESLGNNMNTSNKVWNSAAASNQSTLDDSLKTRADLLGKDQTDKLVSAIPRTNLEFVKIWKLLEQEASDLKWTFLTNLGSAKLKELLHAEINGDLLGKLLVLFGEKIVQNDDIRTTTETTSGNNDNTRDDDEMQFVKEMLEIFPTCNRFKLNVMFLSKEQIDVCKKIFDSLESSKQRFELNELKKLYF